jgi:hypothetical protein
LCTHYHLDKVHKNAQSPTPRQASWPPGNSVCSVASQKCQQGRGFIVRDLPRSEAELRRIPPFEFENWAVIAPGGITNKAQVGDMGIDGRVFRCPPRQRSEQTHSTSWTSGIQFRLNRRTAGRPDIDSFEAMMTRENRTKGFFVSFDYTSDALSEINSFFRKSGRVIVPFTVREILEDQIAQKLA